jgi:hypothetical protein
VVVNTVHLPGRSVAVSDSTPKILNASGELRAECPVGADKVQYCYIHPVVAYTLNFFTKCV